MQYFKSLEQIKTTSISEKNFYIIPEKLHPQVKIKECEEELIDVEKLVKEKKSRLLIDLVWEKNDIANCRLRKTVAEKILRIQENLPVNFALKIYDAHRPISLQQRLFDEIWKEISTKNPKLKGDELYREVTNFIADPKNTPPHSTGAAVDLSIYDLDRKEDVDMGVPVNSISELSQVFSEKLTKEAMQNRLILFNAMMSEGFCNLSTEWWHYSYGDQIWAAFYGLEYAIYASY